jgi:hypothetical protein
VDALPPERLQPADPRSRKYEREVKTDGAGNFAFHDVPPGNYYVACQQSWSEGVFDETNSDGTSTLVPMEGTQWVYAKVSIRKGQTARVESWRKGM